MNSKIKWFCTEIWFTGKLKGGPTTTFTNCSFNIDFHKLYISTCLDNVLAKFFKESINNYKYNFYLLKFTFKQVNTYNGNTYKLIKTFVNWTVIQAFVTLLSGIFVKYTKYAVEYSYVSNKTSLFCCVWFLISLSDLYLIVDKRWSYGFESKAIWNA